MPKLPHQSTVPPAEVLDSVNKDYGDTNYLSGGAGGGAGIESLNLVSASSQYAEIVDASSNGALEGMANLTIEGWFRPASLAGAMALVSKYSAGAGNYAYRFRLETATSMSVSISADGTVFNSVTRTFDGGTTAVAGEWIHLAFTWNGSTGDVIYYVNGVQQGAVAAGFPTGTIFDGTAPFRVGNDEVNNYFNGDVAHVRVWGAVRTQTEIADDMVRTMGGDELALIAYYRFDGNYNDAAGNNPLSGVNTPVFNDVVPIGVPAQSLVTKGNTVTISGSAEPSLGQALVATSSTSAEWTTVATGAVAAALGDYVSMSLSSAQTDVVANDTFLFDTNDSSRGLSVTSGQVTLSAGRTYFLHAVVRLDTTSPFGWLDFAWYDNTGAVQISKTVNCISNSDPTNGGDTRVASTIFTPTVDSIVTLRVIGAAAGMDVSSFGTHADIVEIGAVQADVVGGMEFVDVIEVTGSAVTGVTFGAGGDGVFDRALDGDVDEEYIITGNVLQAISPIDIELNPNGSTTGISSETNDTTNGGNFPVSNSTMRLIGGDQGVGSTLTFEATFWARTGKRRAFVAQGASLGGATDRRQDSAGGWQDTAANITTLELNTEQGTAGIDVGSRFFLYRRTRANLRADTAAVYERQVTAVVAQGSAGEEVYTTGGATFGGSALGISVRMVDDDVTAGTIDVALKVGGITVMTAQLNTTNTTYARAAGVVSQFPVVFGDDVEVGVTVTGLTTTGGGSPALAINVMLANDAYVQSKTGPHYLYGRLSANQTTNIAAGNHVEFDLSASRGDSISLATGSGQANGLFTLQPGKTYELHAYARCLINEGNVGMRWFDDAGEIAIVDDTGIDGPSIFQQDNVATDAADLASIMCLFTPTATTVVKLQIQSQTNLQTVYQSGTHVMIKELK